MNIFFLGTIHEDLLKIKPVKHEGNLCVIDDQIKTEVPEDESFDEDILEGVHDSTEDAIIQSVVKSEQCEVEDLIICDISSEFYCSFCDKYFETNDDLDVHKRLCLSKGEILF